MKRVVAALGLCCLLTQAGIAQQLAQQPSAAATPVEREIKIAYSSCEVMNVLTSGAQPDKWVAPVFEFSYLEGLLSHRLKELATDFGAAVASQGGSGDNVCLLGMSRQELEQSVAETRKTLSRRFLGAISAVKYHDVAWTPKPWDAKVATAAPANDVQFVYCYAGQDSTTIASEVIEVSMPADDLQHSTELQRYSAEFKRNVADPRLPDSAGTCVDSNTQAEAQHKRSDLRRLSSRNDRFIDVTWRPTPADSAIQPATSATATASSTPEVVKSKAESPAPASTRTTTAFRPVAIDLQSLGTPPMLPVVFGFCQHAGLLNSAHKLFMTPVFRIQNSAGEASGVLAQRYVREYKLANDPGKKIKQSSELCSVAGNYAEAEVLRRDLLSAYNMPNATGTGPVLTPIMTEWSPAGGAIAAAPEGAAVALQIICSVPDHARKTVYYTCGPQKLDHGHGAGQLA